MDLNSVLAAAAKIFPNANLNGAVQEAQEAINGTENSLDGVSAAARRLGITPQAVSDIYRRYGSTMQGRAFWVPRRKPSRLTWKRCWAAAECPSSPRKTEAGAQLNSPG